MLTGKNVSVKRPSMLALAASKYSDRNDSSDDSIRNAIIFRINGHLTDHVMKTSIATERTTNRMSCMVKSWHKRAGLLEELAENRAVSMIDRMSQKSHLEMTF